MVRRKAGCADAFNLARAILGVLFFKHVELAQAAVILELSAAVAVKRKSSGVLKVDNIVPSGAAGNFVNLQCLLQQFNGFVHRIPCSADSNLAVAIS